jgi:hypothetical protein
MLMVRLVAFAFIVCRCFAGGLPGLAQEATPETTLGAVTGAPAHIHDGTCAAPGEVVFTLAPADYRPPAESSAGTPVATEYVGSAAANAAIVSVTTIATPLAGLLAAEHAIDIHHPDAGEDLASRIACGAVGGFLDGDDLVFGLQEVNASHYAGTAWLRDNGDGSTTATLFLVSELPPSARVDAAPSPPAAVTEAEPLAPLPSTVEITGVVVQDRAFAAVKLELAEDVPTVLHIVNADDQEYLIEINDLVALRSLPANQLSVIEFTTPSAGVFTGRLLSADGTELDTLPVTVA